MNIFLNGYFCEDFNLSVVVRQRFNLQLAMLSLQIGSQLQTGNECMCS